MRLNPWNVQTFAKQEERFRERRRGTRNAGAEGALNVASPAAHSHANILCIDNLVYHADVHETKSLLNIEDLFPIGAS